MPLTLALYMVGAFAISAVPLFSGFVNKAMVVSAAGESHLAGAFLLLTVASSGTFHTGLKLPYYTCSSDETAGYARGSRRQHARRHGAGCAACIGIGVFPGLLYGYLPYPVDYAPYGAPRDRHFGAVRLHGAGILSSAQARIPNRSSALTPTGFTAAPCPYLLPSPSAGSAAWNTSSRASPTRSCTGRCWRWRRTCSSTLR